MATIVVAVAQQKFREALCSVLTAYRHEPVTVATAEQTVRLIDAQAPELVLFDLALLGLETLAKLRARAPHMRSSCSLSKSPLKRKVASVNSVPSTCSARRSSWTCSCM